MLKEMMYPKRMPVTGFNDETGTREKRGSKAAPACQRTCLTTTQPNIYEWKELMVLDAAYLGPRPKTERLVLMSCGFPDKLCNTS